MARKDQLYTYTNIKTEFEEDILKDGWTVYRGYEVLCIFVSEHDALRYVNYLNNRAVH